MAATNTNRFSNYTSASASGGSEGKNGDQKKDMWSSMLDSVASGKRLPEKNLLVMGMPFICPHNTCDGTDTDLDQAEPPSRNGILLSRFQIATNGGTLTEARRSRLWQTSSRLDTHTTTFWMRIMRVGLSWKPRQSPFTDLPQTFSPASRLTSSPALRLPSHP